VATCRGTIDAALEHRGSTAETFAVALTHCFAARTGQTSGQESLASMARAAERNLPTACGVSTAKQPLAPQATTAVTTDQAHGQRVRTRSMRPKKVILCVDDNEQVLSVRSFLLETRGYRVISARTSAEALEILERTTPGTLDLLIADLLLPTMDGNELVRRAKLMHPTLPALIVSGTVGAFDRALAADAFLPKGAASPAELLERIRVLVARKRGPKKHMPVPAGGQPVLVQASQTTQDERQRVNHAIAS